MNHALALRQQSPEIHATTWISAGRFYTRTTVHVRIVHIGASLPVTVNSTHARKLAHAAIGGLTEGM